MGARHQNLIHTLCLAIQENLKKMKNIILIITDTFRYDNLFNYAKRPVNTPELDRFASERATSVEQFITGSFPTIPHRTDVASGVLGWPHYGWQSITASGPNHIASMLADSKGDYITQLICDCPHLFNSHLNQAFTAAFQHRGQEGDKALLHMNHPIKEVQPKEKNRLLPSFRGAPLSDVHRWLNRYSECEEETFCYKTSATTVKWLEENSQANPFFLWVDFFDPHEPWDAPEYMVRKYDPDYKGTPMIHCNYGRSSDFTDKELHNLWAHYAAESELVDRSIGRILQKIDDLRLWDDSIIIVTSDHGTSLGEHGRTGKSNISEKDHRYWPIYPEVCHVPFLIAGKDIPQGSKLDLIATPMDILPTLCEISGAEIDPPAKLDGRSFAKQLKAGSGDCRNYAVTAANLTGKYDYDVYPEKGVTPFITTQEFGYAPVGADGTAELYNLKEDPFAENDIAARHPEKLRELHDLLINELKDYGADQDLIDFWISQAPN